MAQAPGIIQRNKIYVVLTVFILSINIIVFAGWLGERSAIERGEKPAAEEVSPAGAEESRKIFDEEEIARRQEKIEKLAEEDPRLYFLLAAVNLSVLFVIFLGFVIDGYLAVRFFKKKPIDIRLAEPEKPRWGLADIVRVIIIFLSAGYAFVIVRSFMADSFAVFYNPNFRMVFDTAFMNIVGIAVIFYFVRKKHGQEMNAIGLGRVDMARGIFFGAAGYIALIPVLVVIMAVTYFVVRCIGYEPPVQPIVEVFMEEKDTSILWMSALFAAVFGPIAEEIFFRGFMYPAVREKWGKAAGIIGTSVIFSFLHAHIAGFLPIIALGILLTYLYEKTGTLMVPIAVHIIHNVGMVTLVFIMRGVGV
jgi:uncharacterized protein